MTSGGNAWIFCDDTDKPLDQEQDWCENGSDGGRCRGLRRFAKAMGMDVEELL